MAITRYPPRTVLLGGHDGGHAVIVNDIGAGEDILPGALVMRYQKAPGVSAFRKNNVAAGLAQRAVALNASMLNRGMTDKWASGETPMEVGILSPGDTAWVQIASGAPAVVAGDFLESAGDGTVRKGTAATALFIATEDTNNSTGAIGNPGFVKAEAV
jgi:hypothetical protein